MNKNWNKKYKIIDEVSSYLFDRLNDDIDDEIEKISSDDKNMIASGSRIQVAPYGLSNAVKVFIVKSLIKKLNRSIK